VPELSAFDFGVVIEKIKSYKSPGVNQIPTKLIKAGGRTIRYEIHKLIVAKFYVLYSVHHESSYE
jgi:hypothetical protein